MYLHVYVNLAEKINLDSLDKLLAVLLIFSGILYFAAKYAPEPELIAPLSTQSVQKVPEAPTPPTPSKPTARKSPKVTKPRKRPPKQAPTPTDRARARKPSNQKTPPTNRARRPEQDELQERRETRQRRLEYQRQQQQVAASAPTEVTPAPKLVKPAAEKKRLAQLDFSPPTSDYTTNAQPLRHPSGGVIISLAPGAEAPDFTVKDIFTGDEYNYIRDLKGNNIVLINFWSIFCQPCQEIIPELVDLFNRYKTQDILFVGVSLDGEKRGPAIEKFLKKHPIPYPIHMDVFVDENGGFEMSDAYGVMGTPKTVIIGKDGYIKFVHTDIFKTGEIEGILSTLIEESKVSE